MFQKFFYAFRRSFYPLHAVLTTPWPRFVSVEFSRLAFTCKMTLCKFNDPISSKLLPKVSLVLPLVKKTLQSRPT